jgi:hypothetical protein
MNKRTVPVYCSSLFEFDIDTREFSIPMGKMIGQATHRILFYSMTHDYHHKTIAIKSNRTQVELLFHFTRAAVRNHVPVEYYEDSYTGLKLAIIRK